VDDVQHLGLGIVESHDLFGQHLHVEVAKVHRVANHAEQRVDRLLIRELFLDIRLAEAPQQKIADLVARSNLELGRRLELHAERLFDLGDVGFDFVGVGALSGGVTAATGGGREQQQRDGSSHVLSVSRHSTSVPAINPTTRAMSCPRMTTPSSINCRPRSASSGASIEGRARSGTGAGCASVPFTGVVVAGAPTNNASSSAPRRSNALGASRDVPPRSAGFRFSSSRSMRASSLSSDMRRWMSVSVRSEYSITA